MFEYIRIRIIRIIYILEYILKENIFKYLTMLESQDTWNDQEQGLSVLEWHLSTYIYLYCYLYIYVFI